jgi:hypothetical protein
VRDALRSRLLAETYGARDAVDEFWVPRSNERADLAVIGRWMDGFEIKTDRDTLRRLPRQALAYGRLFDRCTAVLAERHSEAATQILPTWWGITTVHVNGSVTFDVVRKPALNHNVDPEILVRLLWRDEAAAALNSLGCDHDTRAPRTSLWRALLHATSLAQLRGIVRRAILGRDSSTVRIATRRFTTAPPALESGP